MSGLTLHLLRFVHHLVKPFKRETESEAFMRGYLFTSKDLARFVSIEARHERAEELFRLASGTSGDSLQARAFDRGVRSRLNHMGYDDGL